MSILYIMIYKIEKRNPTPILSVFLYIFDGENNFFFISTNEIVNDLLS
jgi:hypothetical protein